MIFEGGTKFNYYRASLQVVWYLEVTDTCG
jgi:hypothetical protein